MASTVAPRPAGVLVETSIERALRGLSRREVLAELLIGLLYVAGCVALWVHAPIGDLRPLPVLTATLVAAVAYRVRFDIGWGYTPSTALAFVVLWASAPPAALPVLMLVATLASLPLERGSRAARVRELLHAPGNHLYTFGPAILLALVPEHGPLVLVAAFGAQLAADFLGATARLWLRGERLDLRDEVRVTVPVWGIDAALAATALPIALLVADRAWAPLATLPLLALLLVFARERRGRLEHLLELNQAYKGVALVLGDVVEADDGYTGEHSQDVLELAIAVGTGLGLPRDRLRDLEFGALLHDVGKITIPKSILHKPGRLTEEEFTVMKSHAAAGQELLDRVGGVLSRVGIIVRHHHERWDGGGYPDAIAGDAIPIESRIIAACDSWNAMRTDRVYRKALPVADAVFEIQRGAGSQFDPAVADALLHAVRAEIDAAAQSAPQAPLPQGLLELA